MSDSSLIYHKASSADAILIRKNNVNLEYIFGHHTFLLIFDVNNIWSRVIKVNGKNVNIAVFVKLVKVTALPTE